MPAPKSNDTLQKDSNIVALLAYLGLFIAILVYLLRKEDRFVRFHALQAILLDLLYMAVFLIVWVVYAVSFLGMFVSFAAGFPLPLPFILFPLIFGLVGVFLLFKLFLMYKAYKQEWYKLPILGNLAEKHAG